MTTGEEPETAQGLRERPKALRLVIAYKLVRGAASALLAVALASVVLSGHAGRLTALLEAVRAHGMTGWIAVALGRLEERSPAEVWLTAAAIVACDGALTMLEGWALLRGRWWGPWLVVLLTGAFVPGELVALARHASAARAAILAVNLVIALYLAFRARRHVRS